MTTRSKDELFQILSNSRRRYIIYYLARADEPVSLNRLATKIAATESDTSESEVTSEERQRVYISLYQTHLPKLEQSGIVTYDEDERIVSLIDDFREDGFFWMDGGRNRSRARFRRYLALLAAGWVLVGGVWLSVSPFTLLGWTGVALLVTVGLTVLVGLQYLEERRGTTDETDGYEMLVE
jgi:hypothetical protein